MNYQNRRPMEILRNEDEIEEEVRTVVFGMLKRDE
jgi:hypothetical protein